MADLFEGFRWKEVILIVGAFLSCLAVPITIVVARMADHEERLRQMEIRQAAVECYINRELCKAIMR